MKQTIHIYYQSRLAIVRDAKIEDVFELADNLRMEDIAEVYFSHHKSPEDALFSSYTNSIFCLTIERNEKPICLFGIVPITILGNIAIIWLLASPELEKIQKAFVKHSRQFIEMMLGYYPLLFNYVDCKNVISIKWLKFCGAIIEEPKPYGIEGAYFRHFYFKRAYER